MGCGNYKKDDIAGARDRGCVCLAVRAIKDIQDAADQDCFDCKNDCFLEPLGSLVSPVGDAPNTRVFKLYNKKGDLFKVHPKHYCWKTPYFRVKNVFDDCCATLQVLKKVHVTGEDVDSEDELMGLNRNFMYVLTGDCITVDLDCFCAIQCVDDVRVEGICD
ncbi:CotY/CotZ family spore coat protein [Rossellomorea sp. AcN35-11]|nr:spore coat protein CotZ [Rossellomorea aquimaris]NMH69434.1 spore coat protein CotZ [Bacillus sp. RO3]WJV29174.1 CotY/CotZ family spore coat protein [Rossellomorea sp. AcN35-11]